MNKYWKKLITQGALRQTKRAYGEKKEYTRFQLAKGFVELKLTVRRQFKDSILMIIGIASAAFGLEGFLLPSKFIDGGATGIALLISGKTGISLGILLVLINIPFIYLGYKSISKQFAIKTAIAICGLAICVTTVHFPVVTQDKLLVALFGGFFLGAGIGFSVRGGAVIDGTEVLAIFLSRKLSTSIGDIIIIVNILIFSAAAYFLNVETALYAMVTYFSASRTLDFIVEGIEEYIGVTIISSHYEEIREMVINKMGRGVTVYKGRRGYGKHGETAETDIVYTVITRLELNKLNIEIQKIDQHAFVVMNSVKDTRGGMIKKRPLKH